jgi:hypothetical protein
MVDVIGILKLWLKSDKNNDPLLKYPHHERNPRSIYQTKKLLEWEF